MKYYLHLLLFFLLLFPTFLLAQTPIWTRGNARTLPQKQFDVALFEPTLYGLTSDIELSSQVLMFPILPNIGLKKVWLKEKKVWYFSSRHVIHYPSLSLKLLQTTGYQNSIPDYVKIPFILSFTNELLYSRWLIPATSCDPLNYLLTFKVGVHNAYKSDTTLLPLDKPVLYQQTAHYLKNTSVWYVGADLDGYLTNGLNFSVDLDFISIKWIPQQWAIQHKGILIFPLPKHFTLVAGYQMMYGTYPSKDRFSIYPLLDLNWSYKIKYKDDRKLFEQGIYTPDSQREKSRKGIKKENQELKKLELQDKQPKKDSIK